MATTKKTTKADKLQKVQEQYLFKEIKDVIVTYIDVYKKLKTLSVKEKAIQMIDNIIIDLQIIKKRYTKKTKQIIFK